MNWQAIGAVGEILGALAVVITLFYLAIQIRQNTRVARAETTKDLYLASRAAILDLAANSDLAETWAKIRGMPDAASARQWALFQSFFRLYELQHSLASQGLLDCNIADSYERVIKMFGNSNGFEEYWETSKGTFNNRFSEFVDALLQQSRS
jgi:hypothetical protein